MKGKTKYENLFWAKIDIGLGYKVGWGGYDGVGGGVRW